MKAIFLVLLCALVGLDATAQTIVLHPGDDIAAAVATASPATTFHLTSGLYRMQQIIPLDGDTFEGETSTVLSGANTLSNFHNSGSLWIASGQTQHAQQHGTCAAGHSGCSFSEDLFFDSKPLQRVTSRSSVGPGKWFFDYSRHQIVFADDPTGHLVETSVARSAFSGSADNVTIKNLIVEKYAIPAQMGAIGEQYPGAGWSILNSQIRLNHGAGIHVKNGALISGNFIHDNGQEGFAFEGNTARIVGNEISNNNYAGFDQDWEAGGGKCALASNVLLQNNYVHNNQGPGLWTDIDSINITYDGNVVSLNSGEGIKHEISFAAVVSNNTLFGNGSRESDWLWGAQIVIQNSQNVQVYGNNITVASSFGNGVAIIYQDRGAGPLGPRDAKNNYIHDNDITYLGNSQAASGMVADYNPAVFFSWKNVFDRNTYHLSNESAFAWRWNGGQNWPGFRSFGFEVNGTLDSNIP